VKFWIRCVSIVFLFAGCTFNYPHTALDPKALSPDALSAESGQGYSRSTKTTPAQEANGEILLAWPVKGSVLCGFGERRGGIPNRGIDLQAKPQESVCAASDGKVVFVSESLRGYGKTIVLDHGNGFESVYAYQSENIAGMGATVKKNEVIAKAGNGGRAISSSLHFELRKNHVPLDPLNYLQEKEDPNGNNR